MDNESKKFNENPHSWNTEANVLYIESPVNVGFSYTLIQNDFNYTDDAVANDNLKVLIYFLTSKFPEFVENDLWIAG